MLEVRDLQSAYGRILALKGISLRVETGEITALVGGNGAGKTTLLRCLSGVQPVSAGRVTFHGDDITAWSPHRRVAAGIAQSPEGRQVFGPLSVEDNLRLGAFRRGRAETALNLDRVFDMFPILQEKRALQAAGLSGGQQQMLAIGRALMSEPRLLMLDEPSMGLAPVLVDQILDAVVALKRAGVTVLLVEQNASAALAIADRGYVIETGRIAHGGSGADLLHDPAVREAYLGV
ncbi:ABC transporter ATP-binding protein [Falsiroseomonas oryzae]|uniref:ABC transporter ATP-binding protein n=1 Tax=Falsiroseomonas oryzae TaxID=2766473 RepID=UPI0022EA41BC|nr:ABC transporter ATP-binding protein [Roseomonas sp. MO-31]